MVDLRAGERLATRESPRGGALPHLVPACRKEWYDLITDGPEALRHLTSTIGSSLSPDQSVQRKKLKTLLGIQRRFTSESLAACDVVPIEVRRGRPWCDVGVPGRVRPNIKDVGKELTRLPTGVLSTSPAVERRFRIRRWCRMGSLTQRALGLVLEVPFYGCR